MYLSFAALQSHGQLLAMALSTVIHCPPPFSIFDDCWMKEVSVNALWWALLHF